MADDEEPESGRSEDVQKEIDGSALLRKVESFLKDGRVKEAPNWQKRAFLLSKGLSDSDIDLALGDKATDTIEPRTKEEDVPVTSAGTSTKEPMSQETTASSPPIITYPEFLQHSERPSPIVTTSRLLTSAYVVSGAAALLYGTGKYLIQPMADSLTAARHTIYESVLADLSSLNEKLENSVSVSPETQSGQQDRDQDELDPSSYFSRTIATQTTPDLASSPTGSPEATENLPSQTEEQVSRLSSVKRALEEQATEKPSEQSIQISVQELRNFLTQLPRSPNRSALVSHNTTWADSKNDEAVAKVKAEIKGVKGALLSARNFPSSVVR